MSNYPRYDQTEFGCLNKDLGGIFAYINYLESKTRADEARNEISRLMSMPPEGLALMDDMTTVFLTIIRRMWKKEDRQNVLPDMCRRFVEATMNVSLPEPDRQAAREKVAKEVMNLYYGFDTKEFEKDFKEIYYKECTTSATASKLDKLDKAAKKAEKEMSDSEWMKTDPKKWFQHVPHRWRDRLVHKTFNHEAMARFIIETFVADWRMRAAKFMVPVSISGVAIETMPGEMGELWLKAYKQLGFDKLDHRGVFTPRKCDIVEVRKSPPSNAKIPKFFQPK